MEFLIDGDEVFCRIFLLKRVFKVLLELVVGIPVDWEG